MPIPNLDPSGFLPVGVHDCTLDEIKLRFGAFRGHDQRVQLFNRLVAFMREAKNSGIMKSVIVNGSFVTAAERPNDIDIILVVAEEHDFTADLSPATYNVVSRHRVHQRFGFDLLVARDKSVEYARWIAFFQEVKLEPGRKKGILQVRL